MNGQSHVTRCNCQHAQQDTINGAHMRHHNECNSGWRCIVCGNVKAKGTR